MNQKNVILDATLLSSLMSCARFTDLRFNHTFQPVGGKSNSLECGSMVHVVLEVFYKSLIAGSNRQDAINDGLAAGVKYVELGDNARVALVDKHYIVEPISEQISTGLQNTPEESDKYRLGWKYVISTCEQYFDFYKNDSWIPIEVEYVKKVILYEDDDLRILWKSKLDLTVDTNNGIYPVDHKTMKQRRESSSLNNQFMGQCITTKTRGVIIDKIGFQSSLKPADKFTRVMVSYSLDRLTEWSQVIVPYYANLLIMYQESGYWPPNFTHCENKYGMCPFVGVCSSDTGMREEELRIGFELGRKWDVNNVDE